ncbi:hypothetical protein KFL_000590030 [Klebsormidium nitens]|uniref:Uncharacterized protein n=1 Tax=Klebsormidium nitens TaxID=105231 RepID=A0A1Y1HUI3_KLENI|nr:hypothetical protein KFL_000590030 [Klebsormidium nitens]|eukprot:GAQ80651.1 hypothetical protein KFL_000590030 [Klebsormidium nitens]
MPGMNASVKFRDGQRPLFKLKMPMTMFGVPLQSGVTVGDGEDFGFHLGTAFAFGPTWRVKYNPNDGNPPALEIKTGLGRWGSNKNAALQVSAEWDLADMRGGGNGRFMLRVKPRLGDFSLRHQSISGYSGEPEEEKEAGAEARPHSEARQDASPDSPASRTGSENGNASEDSLVVVDGADSSSAMEAREGPPAKQGVQRSIGAMRRGAWYLNVHSRLPLGSKANARVRWAVKVPNEMFSSPARGFGALDLNHRPTLVLEKLSIETRERRSLSFQKNIYEHRPHPRRPRREALPAPDTDRELNVLKEDLARVKSTTSNSRSIQKLESENFDLRSALDDLKAQFARGKPRGGPTSSPASVILREEAMLRSQLKHLEEEEERGRRERPRQQEPRRVQEEREDDGDEPAQDDSDISAKLRQALMQRGSRR